MNLEYLYLELTMDVKQDYELLVYLKSECEPIKKSNLLKNQAN